MQRLVLNTPKQKRPANLFGISVVIAQQTAAKVKITIRDAFLLEANLDMIMLTMLKNAPDAIEVKTNGSSTVVDDDVQEI